MKNYQFINWLFGCDDYLSRIMDFEEQQVYDIVTYHRLENQFIHRLSETNAPFSKQLIQSVWITAAKQKLDNHKRLIKLRNVISQMNSNGGDPVIIKGVSTFAITQKESDKRVGKDVDMLVQDINEACEQLKQLGFSIHEYAYAHDIEAKRDDLVIELHKSFPVWRYPFDDTVGEDVFSPAKYQGFWLQSWNQMQVLDLVYEDVANSSFRKNVYSDFPLTVPCPNMAILIRCAHIFKNYVSFDKLHLYLYEISEITSLQTHPAYDILKLQQLMETYKAYDGINFVNRCARHLLGRELFGFQSPFFHRTHFPIWIFYRVWADLVDFDSFILPVNWDKVFSHLGYTTIFATSSSHIKTYQVMNMQGPDNLKRVIVYSKSSQDLPFSFNIARSDQKLIFKVQLSKSITSGKNVYIDVRYIDHQIDSVCQINFNEEGPLTLNVRGLDSNVKKVSKTDKVYHVELDFQKEGFPPHIQNRISFFMLLSVALYDDIDHDPFVIIPLKIVLSHE